MPLLKRTAFSSDGSKFAYINQKDDLIIWDTISNKLINCEFVHNVNACTCIRWIPMHPKPNNAKKAKLCHNDEILLAAGTMKGDILIYNVTTKNLYLHMAGRHKDAINDMCLYKNNNSLFTCSNDQHIAQWDVSDGRQIAKWKADENPIYSICVIDDNNLLSSSNAILWWNISKQTVLKKFSGHATEIRKLLPVNVHSMKSCYFLSAALDDTKINAWSLNSASESCVASFSLPFSPEDMDISKVSSKDKPLLLLTVTKDGHLHLFEHILNGNISELVQPKVSTEIDTECKVSVLSVKFTENTDECIIAYESSKSTIAFKHVKIKELLQENEKENDISKNRKILPKLSLTNCSNKVEKILPVNGFSDSVLCSHKSRQRPTVKYSSSVSPDLVNSTESEVSLASQSTVVENPDLNDPRKTVNTLLEAIKAQNSNTIETIIESSDTKYISTIIKILPTSSLKIILDELNHRLLQKYSLAVIRWLKEILQIHLRYLIQCNDTKECLNQTRNLLSSLNVSKTLHKMTVLQGLLNLQIQNSSSSESDSGDDEPMEL